MKIIVFNFETNQNSQALGFAVDWINALSHYVEKLYVVSLRCGEFNVNSNVEVFCVEQNVKNKIQTVLSIVKVLYKIHRQDKISGYFVHMAHYFVPIIYPFACVFKQKIILWYAHQSTPLTLKIANILADKVLSSTPNGYNLPTNKLEIVGQGIDTEKFFFKELSYPKIKHLVVVGRISKVKNVDMIIRVFCELQVEGVFLHIVGDAITLKDKQYLKIIKENIPQNMKEKVLFKGALPFAELPSFYAMMDLAINLSDTGSLDKAILESMSMGIPILTSNLSAVALFDHLKNNGIFLVDKKEDFKKILHYILNHPISFDRVPLREEIISHHSLDKLAQKIIRAF